MNWLLISFCGLFLKLDYVPKLTHITTLQALLIPAIVVAVNKEVTSAMGATFKLPVGHIVPLSTWFYKAVLARPQSHFSSL